MFLGVSYSLIGAPPHENQQKKKIFLQKKKKTNKKKKTKKKKKKKKHRQDLFQNLSPNGDAFDHLPRLKHWGTYYDPL